MFTANDVSEITVVAISTVTPPSHLSESKSCLSDTLSATLLKEVLDRYSEVVGEDFDFIEFRAAFSRFPFGEQCRI